MQSNSSTKLAQFTISLQLAKEVAVKIIKKQPNADGSYSQIYQLNCVALPDGCYQVTDGVELSCGGFGELIIENDIVIGFTPNTEAWEQWQVEHPAPEPQPTAEEDRDAMLVDLEYRMTLMELGVN